MNYELAKELKEARYPLKPWMNKTCICSTFKLETHGSWVCDHKGQIPYPDLSELIEVCGGRFWLCNDGEGERKWHATSTIDPENHQHAFGSTPSEAVARLWLALNKK